MPRSTPSLPALLVGLALSAQLTGCLTPPLTERPSANEKLGQLLEAPDAPAPELARDLRSLSLQHPQHVPTLIADAALSIETGRADRAVSLLDLALKAEPDNVDAVQLSVQVAARSGDLAGAHRRVEGALRTRPDSPGLHEAHAALLFVERRYAEALEALDRADALAGETSWRSHYHRGLVAEDLGELEVAERHYETCNDLEPTFEPAARRLRWIRAQAAIEEG
jgi:tetratricopeptide (TPR) repeat protein